MRINATMTYQDMFDIILPRLSNGEPPVWDFMSTLSNVVDYLDRRLLDIDSDLIVEREQVPIAAGTESVAVGDRFLALRSHPSFVPDVGSRVVLRPLPTELEDRLQTSGSPEYFELHKGFLVFHPTPAMDGTLLYSAYRKTVVENISDQCPYGGLFNDQIIELLVKFGTNPVNVISPHIDAHLDHAVDMIVHNRTPKHIYWTYPT
mgnify:CR=1 FL=1